MHEQEEFWRKKREEKAERRKSIQAGLNEASYRASSAYKTVGAVLWGRKRTVKKKKTIKKKSSTKLVVEALPMPVNPGLRRFKSFKYSMDAFNDAYEDSSESDSLTESSSVSSEETSDPDDSVEKPIISVPGHTNNDGLLEEDQD